MTIKQAWLQIKEIIGTISLGNVDLFAISDVIVIQVKMRISAEIMMLAMLSVVQVCVPR